MTCIKYENPFTWDLSKLNNDEYPELLNRLSYLVHKDNKDKGFWDDADEVPGEYYVATKLALMQSELSEAVEANRKNEMDDKLKHRPGLDVELADCVIRILDFCGYYNIDIGDIIAEKLEYNRSRPYKHGKNH